MSYEVLARKWRPQQFDEVVGQDHVTQTLKNAIKTGRIANAYLFVGPRGIGKTSLARIFSKALNCVKGPTVTPCDKCDSCREIMAGTSFDVLEIDGASNNTVDQVRDLRDTVKYAPSHGKYRIYVIDEVHMLSVSAFNALLKTLEEPPPHAKFIFATTEPQKVLATIVSRCQRFDLHRISIPLIIERLKIIAKAEKVSIDDDALLAIARGAEGGLRDAESALDQLISFRGSKIVEEDVLSVFGLVPRSMLENTAGKILAGDIKALIRLVAELDEAGKDLQRFVIEMIEYFKNLLVCLNIGDTAEGLDMTEAQIDVLKEQSKSTNTERVLRVTDILSESEDKMRHALSMRSILEVALIRCARAAVVVSIEEIISQINALKSGGVITEKKKLDAEDGKASKSRQESAGDNGQHTANNKQELEMLVGKWREIVEKIGKMAISAKSPLIDARPASVEGNRVVIAVDPEFADEIEELKSSRNLKAVQHVLSAVLNRTVTPDFEVKEVDKAQKTGSLDENMTGGQEKAPSNMPASDGTAEKGKKTKKEWMKEPAVQKTLEMFGGTIVEIRE